MLELPNFAHTKTSTTEFHKMIKFCCDVMNKNYDIIIFILRYNFKVTWSSRFC